MKRPHAFDWVLRCGFLACSRCGLARLKNTATTLAIKNGCKGSE